MPLDRTWFNTLRRRFQAFPITRSLTGQTSTAVGSCWREHMPASAMRQWRMLIGWCSQRVFQRPAALQSLMERRLRDADSPRPVLDHQALAVEFQPAVGSRVAHLFGARRPSHIARLIAAFVIDAIERMLPSRTFANVAQECLKRISPRVAHRDAASAIPAIGRMLRIGTAGFHREPILVFRSGAHPVCARWHGGILPSEGGALCR